MASNPTSDDSQLFANGTLRSGSTGSSFFHKDGLNFFSKEGSEDADVPVAAASDLDIVGALGTLNLDEEFVETDKPQPETNTPFLQPFLQGMGPGMSQNMGHMGTRNMSGGVSGGALTPNPPSVGTFNSLSASASTPSSTWGNNFVPFSAPPFAYPMNDTHNAQELAMQIAPFELPEEQKVDKEQPPMHGFGGILDQRYAFGSFFNYEEENDDKFEKKPIWNQYPQYGRNERLPEQINRYGGYVNNPNPNHRRNNNYNMNGGVNVHRKMHGSRRKGDDAAKYANAKLEDFSGDLYSLCKDQHGCRFLQRQLELEGDLAIDVAATMIFNEIYLKIVELMTDPFGNYLIQKLFENVAPAQRLVLVKNAAPEFIRIALDPHGTRALQKLVECISTPEEARLVVDSLSPHIVALLRDLNGNHVVQKCLQKLKPDDNQFIFDTASLHCSEIATHRHGCCVLQRCLDHGSTAQRKQLSLQVAKSATNLALDPFGNYVVQYVLLRGDSESVDIILAHIKTDIVALSLHKFGSNVIEKLLRSSGMTDKVIGVLLDSSDKFSVLLNDPFGNYVLQTSLDVAGAADLARLALALQPLLPNIKNTPHGRRIMTKIQNM